MHGTYLEEAVDLLTCGLCIRDAASMIFGDAAPPHRLGGCGVMMSRAVGERCRRGSQGQLGGCCCGAGPEVSSGDHGSCKNAWALPLCAPCNDDALNRRDSPGCCCRMQALKHFGTDIGIAFSGAEDVALIEYAHLTGRPYRVFRCVCLPRVALHPRHACTCGSAVHVGCAAGT